MIIICTLLPFASFIREPVQILSRFIGLKLIESCVGFMGPCPVAVRASPRQEEEMSSSAGVEAGLDGGMKSRYIASNQEVRIVVYSRLVGSLAF